MSVPSAKHKQWEWEKEENWHSVKTPPSPPLSFFFSIHILTHNIITQGSFNRQMHKGKIRE